VGKEVASWTAGEGGTVEQKLQHWEACLKSMLENDSVKLANLTSSWPSRDLQLWSAK
jgi:hypothetical protein